MATLRDIRRRINSVKSTQQITKAMKMVAAAKLRKAQERLMDARPYAERLGDLLSHVASQENVSGHPLLAVRDAEKFCYIVVTSDRGLCGSFNSNAIRAAKSEIDALMAEKDVKVLNIGRKGFEFYSRRDYPVAEKWLGIFDSLDFQTASTISNFVQGLYRNMEADRVVVVYNSFKSAGTQILKVQQLLPLEPKVSDGNSYGSVDYLYEPDARQILAELVPKNLNVQIWRILLESYAAEQGARMVAMDSATENAQDMIYDLTLYYNKVRQAAITTEISEIVGGAEALRG